MAKYYFNTVVKPTENTGYSRFEKYGLKYLKALKFGSFCSKLEFVQKNTFNMMVY